MDPNMWDNNGAHFEDFAIWSPAATDYYSDNQLGFLTDHEPNEKFSTQKPADCFTTPHLPISFVGVSCTVSSKLVSRQLGNRKKWKSIKLDFFKDSPRKKDQLKEKWRHMLKSAHTQTNPTLKELYSKAKNVDANLPKCSRACRNCRKY